MNAKTEIEFDFTDEGGVVITQNGRSSTIAASSLKVVGLDAAIYARAYRRQQTKNAFVRLLQDNASKIHEIAPDSEVWLFGLARFGEDDRDYGDEAAVIVKDITTLSDLKWWDTEHPHYKLFDLNLGCEGCYPQLELMDPYCPNALYAMTTGIRVAKADTWSSDDFTEDDIVAIEAERECRADEYRQLMSDYPWTVEIPDGVTIEELLAEILDEDCATQEKAI